MRFRFNGVRYYRSLGRVSASTAIAVKATIEDLRICDYLDHPLIRDALPKSELAKAAGYLRNHGELLQQYTCDGCCPIDNNQTEQLIKTA